MNGNTNGSASTALISRRSNFARLAAVVGRDIEATSIKLAKLTKLAQRRTLFDDPTFHIQELTSTIKSDLNELNGKLDTLSKINDSSKLKSQANQHSVTVVKSLRGRLGNTAEGFKSVLKLRTASLAAQQDRRQHFSSSSQQTGGGFQAASTSVALDLGMGSAGHNANGMGGNMDGEQRLAQVRKPGENSYQHARANAVRQVESTIVELGEIFNQLATMVSEQGEMVERIDANVEDTATNMRAGTNQLIVYYNSIAGNRTLMLKISAVLLVFLSVWVFLV